MNTSAETYRKVANNCSSYEPFTSDRTTNSSCNSCQCEVSCTTCKHFNSNQYCELNLYDKIVSAHHMTH